MSTDAATEADVLRCGYDVGFFDKSDIARWADQQIAAIDAPSMALIDLSMNRQLHPLDVMKLLRNFGQSNPSAIIEAQLGFIGLLLSTNRMSVELAIRGLWSLIHEPGVTDEQQSQIYYLDDGYDLAIAGTYGTMADIDRDLRRFVTPYSQVLATKYPDLFASLTS